MQYIDVNSPRKLLGQLEILFLHYSVSHFVTRHTVSLLDLVTFHDLDQIYALFSVLELEYGFFFSIVTSTVHKKVH